MQAEGLWVPYADLRKARTNVMDKLYKLGVLFTGKMLKKEELSNEQHFAFHVYCLVAMVLDLLGQRPQVILRRNWQ